MEGDEEGSEEEMEPEFSGMEQPPLTHMLKNILSEYPDDGQILKEMIQNAEDAGASEVKILFDNRNVNQEDVNEKKRPFHKYFKGPALILYNNSAFSKEDWRGIKMLYSSVKELDPLKVGRFGLGFKSVFHITDYPMILCGERLLIIDPYKKNPDTVCQEFLLHKLGKYRGMNTNDCREAFLGLFGFEEETLSTGMYEGTLFRFPLRQVATELSGNIYNEQKMEILFDSFRTEAPMTLLFLKNLEEMTLFKQIDGVISAPCYKVKIYGADAELKKRRKFRDDILRIADQNIRETVKCCLNISICVEIYGQQTTRDEQPWFIVNTVLGDEAMSDQLATLSKDKDLSYSPYVGIAIPHTHDETFKGHVFCFLPLPLETRSLTGLPVHVNGFFALSQNRRHVKWPSADLSECGISTDKSLQWNQLLIREVLSKVYVSVVERLMADCERQGNPAALVTMVYRCIPHLDVVDVKWKIILKHFLDGLLQRNFLFTENNGGQWIRYKDAVVEDSSMSVGKEVRDSVRTIMKQYKQHLVIVPKHVASFMKQQSIVTWLTPAFLSNLLRSDSSYRQGSFNEKLHLLEFLMSSDKYPTLEGLELLPLQNGNFARFECRGHPVYMCNREEAELFPSCEGQIVKLSLPDTITQHLRRMLIKSMYQLQKVDVPSMVCLLHQSIDNLPIKDQCRILDTKLISSHWLEAVWSQLQTLPRDTLREFKNLHLVPVQHGKYYHLYKLTSLLLVQSYQNDKLPDALTASFKWFSVTVLPTLPPFMAYHPEVTKYINGPTQLLSVLKCLHKQGHGSTSLDQFNANATPEERDSWRNYLAMLDIGETAKRPLCQMKIFKDNQTENYTSIQQIGVLAPDLHNFPVSYSRRLLSSLDHSQCRLAERLGATRWTEEMLITDILSVKWNSYSDSDKTKLMMYFIRTLHLFKGNDELMKLAKKTRFVPTSRGLLQKPSNLYDPTQTQLKQLLADVSKFPASPFSTEEMLVGLRILELNTRPSKYLIYSCIDSLDGKTRNGTYTTVELNQAKAVSHFLMQQPEILRKLCTRSDIQRKRFLIPMARPSTCPPTLTWYGSSYNLCTPQECLMATTRNQRIVGASMPLISESSYQHIGDAFHLHDPGVSNVMGHLSEIMECYEDKYKPDLLPCIRDVYSYLARRSTATEEIRGYFQDEPWIWTGEIFVNATDVYVNRKHSDIHLEPYMYPLPKEFEPIKHLFQLVGCHEKQTVDVLHAVQEKIRENHEELQASKITKDVGRDLNLIIQILKIYELYPEAVEHLDILFPVHTGSDERLKLMLASECQYSNNDWLKDMAEEEDDIINYVHADIPSHTAKILGVRSLTEELLNDTEGIQPCGQHEDLTCRIKGLLDGYTDGLSVPKEIIQNADDAGAKKVCFLYDERENPDARTRLLDENMEGFQGPALWAYNNAQFTPQDLRNITKLGGATKLEDETKVGKFGLGFCSVYNLTDVPSFVTGSDLVIFDPHYKYLGQAVKGHEPGIQINLNSLQNQKLVRRMKNQFMPFNGVFGCDLRIGHGPAIFDGTLFRLPLRTKEQAALSEIKCTAYTQAHTKELLQMLMDNGGNLLLFTQNVTEIEIYHLPANVSDPSDANLVYQATKMGIKNNPLKVCSSEMLNSQFNILKEASQIYLPVRRKIIFADINVKVTTAAKCFTSEKSQDVCTQWMIAYATGTSASLEISKRTRTKGALPLAGIAAPIKMTENAVQLMSLDNMPFGFYKRGHYFSFLPLPLPTQMPVHINATFAVAPDRRSIMWGTEDDKTELFKPQWNAALMDDAVPNAYIALLESLKNCDVESDEDYWNLWPVNVTSNELQIMQNSFLKKVTFETPEVFKRLHRWAGFESCLFIDPYLLDSEVGDILFNASVHFLEKKERNIMKLQNNIKTSFVTAGLENKIQSRMLSSEGFFERVLFPEIHSPFWQPRDRNRLVLYALDTVSETTHTCLRQSKCIPSEPTGELKRPCEIIHPASPLKELFTTCEGRFVHSEMDVKGLVERKDKLHHIGMIVDDLRRDLIIDRVLSVLELSKTCCLCALERSVKILQYINRKCISDTGLMEELKSIPFLPVMKRPEHWPCPWKGDENVAPYVSGNYESKTKCEHHMPATVQFAKPECLYLESVHQLVGTEEPVLDVSYYKTLKFNKCLFPSLGVRGAKQENTPVKVVCRHLIRISETFDTIKEEDCSQKLLKKTSNAIYTFLDKRISKGTISEEERYCIADLKNHDIIFCNNRFVSPRQTAFKIFVDCSPLLFGLQKHHLGSQQCERLADILEIKKELEVNDLLQVMMTQQNAKKGLKLTEKDLELYTKLIQVLVKCMERQKIDFDILHNENVQEELCIPDVNGFLRPVHQLCMNDNKTIGTTTTMKFVNGKIPPDHARLLGVKSKIKQHFSHHSRKLPFGQKEELTTRIKDILRGYPCDQGIMKELLQNADDAQATELHFVKDLKSHPAQNVFDDKWKPLQGPALLVYNNSSFSKKDIKGIQDLGIGSKEDDPTKTGQYGVGFNAVYHLTDAPSFITKGPDVEGGDTMCVMDPYCRFLSDATEDRPGVQLINLDEHRKLYPDVFKVYHEDELLKDDGTIFRFPLRMEGHVKMTEQHLSDPLSTDKLNTLMQSFQEEMLDALLFVNSVKKIAVSDITSGELQTEYTVEAVISAEDEAKRTEFADHVKDFSKRLEENPELSSLPTHHVHYNITVNDNEGISDTWLIVQQIGFGEGDIPLKIIEAYRNAKLGLLPRGGVAIRLSSQPQRVFKEHRAFCFLPLPLQTGLPVHINGHFALGGETRSSLWNKDQGGYRWEWNELLLTRIISTVYVLGMEQVKRTLLTDKRDRCPLQKLDNIFPMMKATKDSNWELLAQNVLREIYNDGHELFYLNVFLDCKDDTKMAHHTFVPLKDPQGQFPAVFNSLHKYTSPVTYPWEERKRLEKIMRILGLRLLDSPTTIYDSMEAAGVPVSEISPEFMMKFMKYFGDEELQHKCNIVIQENGTPLSETSLHNMENVVTVLLYLKSSEVFVSDIIGVPLCLTEDEKLHQFKEGSEIFCNDMFTILPQSGKRFLHQKLVCMLDMNELQDKVFKSFDVTSFATYLPENLRPEMFRNPNNMADWLPNAEGIPNRKWIHDVWSFLTNMCKNDSAEEAGGAEKGGKCDIVTIPDKLNVVSSWNLVPCTIKEKKGEYEAQKEVLLSLATYYRILNMESFSGSLKESMEKLLFPVLKTSTLSTSNVLSSIIPAMKKPAMVLNYLYVQCNQPGYQNLCHSDCNAIMGYFADHFKQIQEDENWILKLKSLPLHITVHGVIVSLEMQRHVLLLPAGIPKDGIGDWAQKSGTLLLKQNDNLKGVYGAFGYTQSNQCEVYTSHILRQLDCLKKAHIPIHLKYIREYLLPAYGKFSEDQQHLITVLKQLRIFDTGSGTLHTASELYSPHVDVMKAMCGAQDFPPKPFDEGEWKAFMELIGMVNSASNELIIKFAHQIETDGMYKVSKSVIYKSKVLLSYIWTIEKLEERCLLPAICNIKFLVPHRVDDKLHDIFPQYKNEKLIAFEGAVPNQYTQFTWTSCNILSESANPFIGFPKKKSQEVARQLQVCLEKPPLEKIIQHTQNICDELKSQCEAHRWRRNDEFLIDLMTDIYEYLWKYGAKQSILNERLRQTPIVYLPSENKYVTCGVLAIRLEDVDAIKPYLYTAPELFGRHFDLFYQLGTVRTLTCATYAKVLERIANDSQEKELTANELQCVRKALDGLFSCLKRCNENDVALDVPTLYLPTEDKILVHSTDMIYPDNEFYYRRIGDKAGLPYFVGFLRLELNFLVSDMENLPKKYRPHILSDMVNERIDTTHFEIIHGEYIRRLQEYIQTPEFVEGILRMAHHDMSQPPPGVGTRRMCEVSEKLVVSSLQRIQVLRVTNLKVDLVYKETVVGCHEHIHAYFDKEETGEQTDVWKFYTTVEDGMDITKWLANIEHTFTDLIWKSTNVFLLFHGSLMLKILMELDHPENIQTILDQNRIREYHIQNSDLELFPRCGTFVHEKWYCMLDNTTFMFDVYEYVALQLNDDDTEDEFQESVYVYAKIVERIGSERDDVLSAEFTKYKVDVGESRILEKLAFEIYKFLRKKTASRDLVPAVDVSNDGSNDGVPLAAVFHEVRRKLKAIWDLPLKEKQIILKRYLRKWHPDKNIGNEERATQVFQYIQFIWDKLTRGEHVDIDADDADSSEYSQPRQSPNRNFYDNIFRQCSRERQQYESSGSSRGFHRRNAEPVSNLLARRKWFKQAEQDCLAADCFLELAHDVEGYNWICYMCHQAAEKALESLVYTRDANKVNRSHDLCEIVLGLADPRLTGLSSDMQRLLGEYTYMRYPDVHAAGKIPSTSYDKAQAEAALKVAKAILEEVEEKH